MPACAQPAIGDFGGRRVTKSGGAIAEMIMHLRAKAGKMASDSTESRAPAHARLSRPSPGRARKRRSQGRPHGDRNALRLRPADALRSRARLSLGHDQEAASQIDRARAFVVSPRRYEYRLSQAA